VAPIFSILAAEGDMGRLAKWWPKGGLAGDVGLTRERSLWEKVARFYRGACWVVGGLIKELGGQRRYKIAKGLRLIA